MSLCLQKRHTVNLGRSNYPMNVIKSTSTMIIIDDGTEREEILKSFVAHTSKQQTIHFHDSKCASVKCWYP